MAGWDLFVTNQREMLMEVGTGRRFSAVENEPLLTSAQKGWDGILLEKHQLGEVDRRDVCTLNHIAFLQLNSVGEIEWTTDQGNQRHIIQPGTVSFVPAYIPHSIRSRNIGEFLSVSLEPRYFLAATADVGGLQPESLQPCIGRDHPMLRQILLNFANEAVHGVDPMYVDSLGTFLSVQLLRDFSNRTLREPLYSGGLSKPQLKRVIECIHAELGGSLNLARLAAVAGLSPFHFARLFKKSTGQTPHEFVVRLRVQRARALLLESPDKLTDIAVQVGFCDQSHLTRHFRRVYGTTPGHVARLARSSRVVERGVI
jgi:AraC family transcriptional regulator